MHWEQFATYQVSQINALFSFFEYLHTLLLQSHSLSALLPLSYLQSSNVVLLSSSDFNCRPSSAEFTKKYCLPICPFFRRFLKPTFWMRAITPSYDFIDKFGLIMHQWNTLWCSTPLKMLLIYKLLWNHRDVQHRIRHSAQCFHAHHHAQLYPSHLLALISFCSISCSLKYLSHVPLKCCYYSCLHHLIQHFIPGTNYFLNIHTHAWNHSALVLDTLPMELGPI